MIFSEHAFLVYRIATLANSAVPVVVPEKNLRADVDAMLAAVTAKTRLVYLANPNNPTGTYLPHDEVRRLHAGLAARHAAGDRRGLCRNTSGATITSRASRWWRTSTTW